MVLMVKIFRKYVGNLIAAGNERKLLQQVYLLIAGALVIIAGWVSLINRQAGLIVFAVAGAALATFILNIVIWSLIKTNVDNYLDSKSVSVKKKR
jgi:hypothetical protein